ncbi:aminotransferase class III-fold pyridoxal phosphate-dependent enzyme [Helicobacter sp. 23-1044]
MDKEIFSKKYLLDTYARDYTHFVRGEGAKLYTDKGEEFIDFTAGIGVNALGHNHPALVKSIANQAQKVLHLSNLFYIDSQAHLAKKMVELAGQGSKNQCEIKVFFCNSGLEANECAIKIARIYGERFRVDSAKNAESASFSHSQNAESASFCHSNGVKQSTTFCHSERSEESKKNRDFSPMAQNDNNDFFSAYKNHRYKIITLKNSFHGRSIATLRACGQDKMHTHFSPFPDGFLYAKDISEMIELAKSDNAVAAVFIELIQGEGGIYALPKEQVQELARFCDERDILLMIDEVQSGVFRSGKFLASQYYEIAPNVVTLAKGLAGGVPIGAVMCDKGDIFAPSQHGSTFGGNPLSTTAGLTTLEVLEKYQKSGDLAKNIALFDSQLQAIKSAFSGVVSGVSGVGFMRGLKIKDDETLGRIIAKAREKRLLVLRSGNATLRFLPPLLISEGEIDDGFARLKSAFGEI